MRGKLRQVEVQVTELDAAGRQVLSFRGSSAEGTGSVLALAMSARRTRLNVTVDIAARTLAARLFLHSIRLARLRVKRRFDARLDKLGQEIALRYRESGQR
jgi:carbon monoxide dehydrogenase subunit G